MNARTKIGTTFSAIVILVLAAGCATAPVYEVGDEWRERKRVEFEKLESQFSFHCIPEAVGVNYVVFFYTPWDKLEFEPVAMPELGRDFIKKVVANSERFVGLDEVEGGLNQQVNDLLNTELDHLRDGTFNAVYIRIDEHRHIGLAPADEKTVHVWIPAREEENETDLEENEQYTAPPEEVWVFGIDGTMIEHLDADAVAVMEFDDAYHKAWTRPHFNAGYHGWALMKATDSPGAPGEPLEGVGYWTFASWPAGVSRPMIDACSF